MKDVSEFHSVANPWMSQYVAFIADVPPGLTLKTGHVFISFMWVCSRQTLLAYTALSDLVPLMEIRCSLWGRNWSLIIICRPCHNSDSRRPLTAETWIQFLASAYERCVGKSGTGTSFSLSILVFLHQYHMIFINTSVLPEGQTDESWEPSTKRNALTEIMEHRTENCFDLCSFFKSLTVGHHECHQR